MDVFATRRIQVAYKDADTRWGFTVPQEGEADSAEAYRRHVLEVDAALMSPSEKAQLTSGGRASDAAGDGYAVDEYLSSREGADVWVTSLHRHAAPKSVPHADSADSATSADSAKSAGRLSPGFSINGAHTDGTGAVEITADDVDGCPRVFWGTSSDPSSVVKAPRRGDLYVRVSG